MVKHWSRNREVPGSKPKLIRYKGINQYKVPCRSPGLLIILTSIHMLSWQSGKQTNQSMNTLRLLILSRPILDFPDV